MSEGNYSLKEMRTSAPVVKYLAAKAAKSEGNYSLKEMRTTAQIVYYN